MNTQVDKIIAKLDPQEFQCDDCKEFFTNEQEDYIVSKGMNLCSICGKYFAETYLTYVYNP